MFLIDLFFPAMAYAAEGDATSITSTISSSFSSIASDAMGAISSTLPTILPVMGMIVVVGVAVKLFKRFVH